MLDHNAWIKKFLAQPGYNDAAADGVGIVTVPGAEWRVVGVHLLTGPENRGKQNIFIEPVDGAGNRISGVVAEYTWEGRRPDEPAPPTALDKPPNEPAGNIPLGAGQIATVWIRGVSDKVSGLTTAPDIPDVPGATRFHQSTLVVFQRRTTPSPPLPLPPPTPPLGNVEAALRHIEAAAVEIEGARKALKQI